MELAIGLSAYPYLCFSALQRIRGRRYRYLPCFEVACKDWSNRFGKSRENKNELLWLAQGAVY